eukprot:3978906-Prymnesium_polylepis.1
MLDGPGTAVGPAVGVGGNGEGVKPPPEVIAVGGGGPAAASDTDGYRLVVYRRRGARGRKAAKEAVERAPAGRLRVQKGGKPAAGHRYGV